MNVSDNPHQNYLLDSLPNIEYARLKPYLEPIPMTLGEVVYESGDTLNYLYFPTTCIVSMLYVMENGASAEIAVVGNEGIIGVGLFMGGGSVPNRAVVQSTARLPIGGSGKEHALTQQWIIEECH